MLAAPGIAGALVGLVHAGCAGARPPGEADVVSDPMIEEVLAAHTESLMALPGVVGTAIGVCDGTACIRVFLSDSSAALRRRIPSQLDGYAVKAEVTGSFRPRPGEP